MRRQNKLAYNYDIHQEAKIMKELQNQKVSVISEDSLKLENRSFCNEFSMLLLRSYRNSYRNPIHMKNRVFMLTIITLVTLSLFWNLGYDYDDTFSKAGFIFCACTIQITVNYSGTVLNIIAERDILRKEYKSKTYGIAAIYFSRSVFELPIMFMLGLIFGSVNYFGANLENNIENFSVFVIVIMLLIIFSQAFGLLIGTMFEDDKVTISLTSLLYGPIFIFGGCMGNINKMYVWIRWFQYLSPIRFAHEILLKNEFDGNSKYKTNANDRYGLNLGIVNGYVMLIMSIFITEVLSIITLKRIISKRLDK